MIYCTATNYGKNFITFAENAKGLIEGFPGEVWAADDVHTSWITKVKGVSKTKAEAQAIVDAAVDVEQVAWDNDPQPIEETPIDGDSYNVDTCNSYGGGKGYRPGDVTLP